MKLQKEQTYAQTVEVMGKPDEVEVDSTPPYRVTANWGRCPWVCVIFRDGKATRICTIGVKGIDTPK